MDILSNQFIGTGWKYPIEFNPDNASVAMIRGVDSIENSLRVLFATAIGERVMHPDYGSELDYFVFERLNKGVITYMQAVITDAILFNEPRIVAADVTIERQFDDGSILLITVDYKIATTNNRYNFVYPFYLTEATNLPL